MNLRADMPKTAEWVDRTRQELGAAHVNGMIRRAMQGEPGCFYAFERGHVLGTPFPATDPMHEWQAKAVLLGSTFAGFIRSPEKGAGNGKN